MVIFTLADGNLLVLSDSAQYQIVSRRLPVQGGSPERETHRLEEVIAEIKKAVDTLNG